MMHWHVNIDHKQMHPTESAETGLFYSVPAIFVYLHSLMQSSHVTQANT